MRVEGATSKRSEVRTTVYISRGVLQIVISVGRTCEYEQRNRDWVRQPTNRAINRPSKVGPKSNNQLANTLTNSQIRQLVSWCFKSSQPQRIMSRLRETFIKRYIVERTNKVEIRPEELSEKTESCLENSRLVS